jgi:hypothetical protein
VRKFHRVGVLTGGEFMSGRLVRVRSGELRPVTYIVAVPEADKAVALIRSSIGQDGDEITDLGRVSPELLKALAIEPGDFKSTDEPTISQQQQQPQQPAA